jgi:hypothetical protein
MKRYFIAFAVTAVSICAPYAQTIITGDAYIYNSACVGLDCVVPESFGYVTIKMKENNTQIKFEDTSTPGGGFPSMDWTIGANETENGGKDLFFIDDETHRIMAIEGGAPASSLYVNPLGHLGLKTNAPAVELHLYDDNEPTIRLEQYQASYAAQTWDIAAREDFFSVRDITNGGWPLKLTVGAPTNSFLVHLSGNVSLGTDIENDRLYVNGNMKVNGNVTLLSDSRIKSQIEDLDYGLASILKLSPKKYEYAQDNTYNLDLEKGTQIGLIAQEVEAIIPEIVRNDFQVADAQGQLSNMKGIDYVELIPVLIKAIQEQQVLIDKQNAKIAEMESRMAKMDE